MNNKLKSGIVVFGLVIFILISGGCAQSPAVIGDISTSSETAADVVHLQPEKYKGQALYKLETENTVMYFFGAIHVGRSDFYPFPKKVETAFNESQNLVVEINVKEINIKYMEALFQEKHQYKENDSLKKHLPSSLINKIDLIIQKNKVPAEALYKMKPLYAATTLTRYLLSALGYNENYGIDIYFINKASKNNQKITGLETTKEQINLLASIPEAAQIKYLDIMVNKADLIGAETNKIVEAWKAGNVHGIQYQYTKIYKENNELNSVEDVLLTKRNHIMKDRLIPLIKSGGTYFVAIGTSHYIGENNVLVLLAKAGYTINRL